MTREEIIEHCNDYGYSDEEVGAYKDGYNQGREDVLMPYDVESIEELIENVRNKVFDECITKLLTESITCFSDVISTLEQLKERD